MMELQKCTLVPSIPYPQSSAALQAVANGEVTIIKLTNL